MCTEMRNSQTIIPRSKEHVQPPPAQTIPPPTEQQDRNSMVKYFYFGVRRTKDVTDTTGRSRKEHFVVWGKKSYPTPQQAIQANIQWWTQHPTEDPIVRGFDKPLQ